VACLAPRVDVGRTASDAKLSSVVLSRNEPRQQHVNILVLWDADEHRTFCADLGIVPPVQTLKNARKTKGCAFGLLFALCRLTLGDTDLLTQNHIIICRLSQVSTLWDHSFYVHQLC